MTAPGPRPHPNTRQVLLWLAEYFRLCNDNAREFSHHYREQCDRLRAQIVRDGHPDVDGTYLTMKPKDDAIQTAMSRWTWWTNEAARVAREIRTETFLSDAGLPMDPVYTTTMYECLTAARRANHSLRTERWKRSAPTVPMPRVQVDAQTRTGPRR